jgi:hypothetical protein
MWARPHLLYEKILCNSASGERKNTLSPLSFSRGVFNGFQRKSF